MALARCIGGAVRGFGRRVLARIGLAAAPEPGPGPAAERVLELVERFKAMAAEAGAQDAPAFPSLAFLSPAFLRAVPKRNALGLTIEDYMRYYPEELEDEPEDDSDEQDAEDTAFGPAFVRWLRASMTYRRLNWRTPGLGMIPLGRNMDRLTSKNFQRRICVFGGGAS
jgi:hypothetical protein